MEEGDQTDIILLDFAKAFDKVPHDRLLHKMEFYGVRQNTLEWIKQFLTNRTQSVILENHKSDPLDVVSGVPQGTVMGPLLFLAYINDLPEATSSSARLFADDCLLFRRIRKIQDAVDLQNDLSSLEEWERKWQMCFHPEKCIVIRVPGKRQFHQTSYTLHRHTLDAGLDINVCPIPVKNDVGQVDLVLQLSDGTSEKIRFPNVPVRRTNLFPLV